MLKQGCAACQGGVDQQESVIVNPFGLDCDTGFFDQGPKDVFFGLVSWLALYGQPASDKHEAVRHIRSTRHLGESYGFNASSGQVFF